MTCKPIDKETSAKEIAAKLIPENWLEMKPKYWSDVNSGQRLFAKMVVLQLLEAGFINPWDDSGVKPLPDFANGNNSKPDHLS